MRTREEILAQAQQVFQIESEAIQKLSDRLGDEFVQAVELLLRSPGRVIVTGMGKSGHIGKKMAATLASTGTPAYYIQPKEFMGI